MDLFYINGSSILLCKNVTHQSNIINTSQIIMRALLEEKEATSCKNWIVLLLMYNISTEANEFTMLILIPVL